ncbi:MAG TPA: ABC transporter substrate-binding protein [Pseudonocardiaceae bacterium]|jgi:peptide/nickel transport system substrate-binding protein|nr:ABC transporter substrate-binding protein [Pseudonocardiaceae bacterium]
MVALALGCAGLAVLAACGQAGGGGGNGNVTQNEALTQVVNPSNATGGVLKLAESDQPDSTDPGNTYYAYTVPFERLYARTLLTYNPVPGPKGLNVVPDLATGLGTVSSDGLTWTYHLKQGLKFEDGEPIVAQDVKYAIERSANYTTVLPNGPTYFQEYLTDPTYPGAYNDPSPDKMGLQGISTPDNYTLIFHLQKPFADFNYLVTMLETAPVPPAKDTGSNYQNHPLSSGPYMFKSYSPGKSLVLVPNPQWKQSTDATRKQLNKEIDVTFGVNADDVDNRLLSGDIDLDLQSAGMQPNGRATALSDPTKAKNTDAVPAGRLWYIALNTQVAPLNNVHCREAVEYAIDKVAAQTAYGGPVAGGQIASTIIPPTVSGYTKFDDYEALSKPHGDDVKAKQQLALCGQPNGFTVNISARSDRDFEMNAATAAQQSLAKVGIHTDIQGYPHGTYLTDFAGSPNFVHQHDLGIMMMGWAADWPDGYGFLQQIVDGRSIKQAGNSNIEEEKNSQVDTLIDQAAASNDPNQRNQIYGQIDKLVMQDAVIVPEVYANALLYRNPQLTNVYASEAYGMYDFATIGVSSSQ